MLENPRLNQVDVFDLIRAERAYQDAKWGPVEAHGHELAAWLMITQLKFALAMSATQVAPGECDIATAGALVKVAALVVACLEQHGGPLLARLLADQEFTRTNCGYMSPSERSKAWWPVLDAIRERMKSEDVPSSTKGVPDLGTRQPLPSEGQRTPAATRGPETGAAPAEGTDGSCGG